MASADILKSISLNGHNSAIFELICTKFDTDTENEVPGQFLPSDLVSDKIEDGGGRHIENHILAITRPLLHMFGRNTIYRGRERGLRDRVAMKIQM